MSRILQLSAIVLLAGLIPAASQAGDPANRQRVAVLPLSSLAIDPATVEKTRRQLIESLEQEFDVRAVGREEIDRAVLGLCGEPDGWWECLGRDENLFQIGRQLGAGWVIAGKLAAMGDTRVLKFRTADVSTSTVSSEIINIRGGDPEAYLTRFLFLHQHRLPRHQPKESWYQKWYFWTAAGLVAAAAVAGGLYFGLSSQPEDQWDLRRTLP